MQLREKQKVKFIYGVLEKQFHGCFNKARTMNDVTGRPHDHSPVYTHRQRRLPVLASPAPAKRLVSPSVRSLHRERQARGHPVYRVKAGDVVAVGEKFRDLLPIKEDMISSERFEVPGWLEVDIEKLSGNVLALRRVSRSAVI